MRMVAFCITILHIIMFNVTTYAQDTNIEHGDEVTHLNVSNVIQTEWSLDLSKLAVLTGEQILVWNTEDWQLLYTIPDAYVYEMAWHPTGSMIAGLRAGRSEELWVWDGDTGELQDQMLDNYLKIS